MRMVEVYNVVWSVMVMGCVVDLSTLASSIPGAVLQTATFRAGVQVVNLTLPLRLQAYDSVSCDVIRDAVSCPVDKGWKPLVDEDGTVCVRFEERADNFDRASSTCRQENGRLLSIRSEHRQRAVEEFLKDVDSTVWTGLFRPGNRMARWVGPKSDLMEKGDYMNWADKRFMSYDEATQYPGCMFLNYPKRTWVATSSLECYSYIMPFICERRADCTRKTVFGDFCEKECHCHGGMSCLAGEPCPYGCERGWMGPNCCAKKRRADVAYYCVNSPEQGRQLMLRVDTLGVSYDSMVAVDGTGRPLPWCEGLEVSVDQEGRYTVNIAVTDNNESMMGTRCAGNKTGKNTFEWTLSLQEKAGLWMTVDRVLHFACDFDTAESMHPDIEQSVLVDTSDYSSGENQPDSEVVSANAAEQVNLVIVDPDTGNDVTKGMLGSSVRLCVRLTVSDNDLMAKGISPYDCRATPPDGTVQKFFTDQNGCPLNGSAISALQKQEEGVCTSAFVLFALPGYRDVTFTCSVEFCFEDDDPLCDDRCAASQSDNTTRTKRDVSVHRTHAATTFTLLSEPEGPGH